MLVTDEVSDEKLWHCFCVSGDREALGEILYRHGPGMRRLAMRVLGSESDADDAIQVACERILAMETKQLNEVRSIKSWLLGLILNCSRSIVQSESRLRARHQRAAQQDETQRIVHQEDREAELEHHTLLQNVSDALRELPASYQETLMLHYLEGLQFKDVGLALGRSEEAVKKQAQRGLKKLRNLLQQRGVQMAGLTLGVALETLHAEKPVMTSKLASYIDNLRQGTHVLSKVTVAEKSLTSSLSTSVLLSSKLLAPLAIFTLIGVVYFSFLDFDDVLVENKGRVTVLSDQMIKNEGFNQTRAQQDDISKVSGSDIVVVDDAEQSAVLVQDNKSVFDNRHQFRSWPLLSTDLLKPTYVQLKQIEASDGLPQDFIGQDYYRFISKSSGAPSIISFEKPSRANREWRMHFYYRVIDNVPGEDNAVSFFAGFVFNPILRYRFMPKEKVIEASTKEGWQHVLVFYSVDLEKGPDGEAHVLVKMNGQDYMERTFPLPDMIIFMPIYIMNSSIEVCDLRMQFTNEDF